MGNSSKAGKNVRQEKFANKKTFKAG